MIKYLLTIAASMLLISDSQMLSAKNPDNLPERKGEVTNSTFINLREDCQPTIENIDLEINNVRARLLVGGDIWWQPGSNSLGRYVVPKPPVGSGIEEVSSLFAGGVWLGGFDENENLKLAASTYPTGSERDYWPGPLDSESGLTESTTCQEWDRFFTVEGDGIRKAIAAYNALKDQGRESEFTIDDVADDIRNWPGQGNIYFEDRYGFVLPDTEAGLGNFWDEEPKDGVYSPERGDFPIIDIRGCEPASRAEAQELVPDQMIFWIYNDAGNRHGASNNTDPINMEVQVQAFAYATNDEVNDMTFLRYKLINRAEEDIRQAYFAMWVDPDLGCSVDDYVGCDVERSLSYTYNADILDGEGTGCACTGTTTYCDDVPMIGTDYFRGPIAPKVIVNNDGGCTGNEGTTHVVKISDSFSRFSGLEVGDTICIRDPNLSLGEEGDFGFELGMSSFIYYNRPGAGSPDPNTVDPQEGDQFYSYLEGKWLNLEPLTVGGSGFNPGSTDTTRYAVPDPPDLRGGWSMAEVGLPQIEDRRTVQASGPFLLQPNTINELIVGAVWVPDVTHPAPSLQKLGAADDIAQNLFDNCFDIIDGPDAPTICAVELDQELVLVLHNDLVESNNARFSYNELDIRSSSEIPPGTDYTQEEWDSIRTYRFEGYRIFQLIGPTVSPQEFDDIEKSLLVATVDVKNGVSELYNWTASADPNAEITNNPNSIWTPELMVTSPDGGIESTFRITEDRFASGTTRLINHKKYYYAVVAYAYNNYASFDPRDPLLTQATPYLEGRGNVQTYTLIPRPIVYESLNSVYGDGAKVTRLDGTGVGGNFLDMEEEMYDIILNSDDFDGRIEYKDGAGPLTVKIFNPIEARDGKFQLEIIGNHISGSTCEYEEGATWILTDLQTDEVIASEASIDEVNEQIIADYGFSITVEQTENAGSNSDEGNGALGAVISYSDADSQPWFRGVTEELNDQPVEEVGFGRFFFNFIKTGGGEVDEGLDNSGRFSRLDDGYWYPFMMTTANFQDGPPIVTPAWASEFSDPQSGLRPPGSNAVRDLNNVDIIMTSDKSKWSRCMVVETRSIQYGSNEMMRIKVDNPSVDKNGNQADPSADPSDNESDANYLGATGFSWFPGYAIDIETGKRLNIFFGENSLFDETYSQAVNGTMDFANGDDMLYNPTDRLASVDNLVQVDALDDLYLGGQHFIYLTRQDYDGCASLRTRYDQGPIPFLALREMLQSLTWCSMSMMQEGQSILSYADGIVPTDVSFKLRVNKPYNLEREFNILTPSSSCEVIGERSLYEFEITGKTAEDVAVTEGDEYLSDVNVVPNPYYAFSAYETSQFTKTVKITNLPAQCDVTIYSLDGKFIKQFKRDLRTVARAGANPGVLNSQINPDLEWDLENTAGIPIASGVYLVHIAKPATDTEPAAERTIKWFGVNRQFDPTGQ